MEMDEAKAQQRCNEIPESPERQECILRALQDDVTFKYIPLIVYLCVVAVVGMIGNSLIVAVYYRRRKKTATIVFIEAIAVTDLLTNVLVIPLTYYMLLTSVTVETYLCRMYYFLNYSTTTTSVVLLLAVAVVRYRKICVPFGRQVTARHARFFSVAIALLCGVMCVPHTVVYGRTEVLVASYSPNVTVYECSIDDVMTGEDPTWPRVIGVLSILIFLLCCVPLTVMYARIGFEAQRRRRLDYSASRNFRYEKSEDGLGGASPGKEAGRQHRTCLIADVVKVEKEVTTSSFSRDNDDVDLSECCSGANEKDSPRGNGPVYLSRSRSRIKTALNRTTVMLITISAIYILTNLTTLVLILFKAAVKLRITTMTTTNCALFSIFLYSFALNSAVNAIIYIALDRNFRLDCLKLMRSFSCS